MTGRIFLTLLDMMRLRSGPQDLPAGWPLAAGLALAYIAQGFFIDQMVGESNGAPRSLVARRSMLVLAIKQKRGFFVSR